MTHSYVCRDLFTQSKGDSRAVTIGREYICVTRLIYMCAVPHPYVCHGSFTKGLEDSRAMRAINRVALRARNLQRRQSRQKSAVARSAGLYTSLSLLSCSLALSLARFASLSLSLFSVPPPPLSLARSHVCARAFSLFRARSFFLFKLSGICSCVLARFVCQPFHMCSMTH